MSLETKQIPDSETKTLVDISLKEENEGNIQQVRVEVNTKGLAVVSYDFALAWNSFANSVVYTLSDDAEFKLRVSKDSYDMVIVDEQTSEFATYEQKALFEKLKASAIATVKYSSDEDAQLEIIVKKQTFN